MRRSLALTFSNLDAVPCRRRLLHAGHHSVDGVAMVVVGIFSFLVNIFKADVKLGFSPTVVFN